MKKIIKISSILAATVLACTCGKDSGTQESLPGGEVVMLTLKDTTEIPPLGCTRKVAFTSEYDWTLYGDTGWDKWISSSKTTGKAGTTEFEFTFDTNNKWVDRNVNIIFYMKNGHVKKYNISQKCPYLRLRDRNDKLWDNGQSGDVINIKDDGKDCVDLKWNDCDERKGDDRTYKIESNVNWKIELVDDSQFGGNVLNVNGKKLEKASPVSRNGDGSLTIQPVNQNIDTIRHDVKIRIVAMNGNSEIGPNVLNQYEMKISQDYLVFLLNGSAKDPDMTLSELTAEYDVNAVDTVAVYAGVPWEVSATSVPEWLTVSPMSAEANDITKEPGPDNTTALIFTIKDPNPWLYARPKSVELVNKESGAKRIVNLTQKAYSFNSENIKAKYEFENEDAQSYKIELNTTGPWSFDNVPSWLQITRVKAEGSSKKSPVDTTYSGPDYASEYVGKGEITFCVPQQNLNFTENNRTFTIKSNFTGHEYSDIPVPVTQKPFIFHIKENRQQIEGQTTDLTKPSNLDEMLSQDTERHEINTESSGEWDVDIEDDCGKGTDWISFEEESSNLIVVRAKSGNDDENNARSVNLNFYSKRHVEKYGKANIPSEAKTTIRVKQGAYRFISSANQIVDGKQSEITSDEILIPAYKNTKNKYDFLLESEASDLNVTCPDFMTKVKTDDDDIKESEKKIHAKHFAFEMLDNFDTTKVKRDILKFKSNVTGKEKEYTVVQDKFVFDLNDSEWPDEDPVKPEPVSLAFNLTKEAKWQATSSASWLVCSNTSGSSDGKVSLSVGPEPNGTIYDRNAYVTISVPDAPFSKKISFKQGKYIFNSESVDKTNFYPLQNTREPLSFTFDVESSGPWRLKNKPDWIEVVPETGDGNYKNVKVNIKDNDKTTQRDETFIVWPTVLDELGSQNKDLQKNIRVSQKGYTFEVTEPVSKNFGPVENYSKLISVTSSGSWKANSDVDWLKLGVQQGSGYIFSKLTESVNVTAGHNRAESQRTGHITVVTDISSSMSKKIEFTQEGFVLKVDEDKVTGSGPLSTQEINVYVTSSTNNLTANSSNPSVAGARTGSSKIIIVPCKNTERKTQTAKITVGNEDCDFYREIEFTQPAYVFEKENDTDTLKIGMTKGATLVIPFKCSGSWTAECDAGSSTWLKCANVSGEGNGTVTVSVIAENTEPKTGTVTIKCVDNPAYELKFIIKQS